MIAHKVLIPHGKDGFLFEDRTKLTEMWHLPGGSN